MRFVKLCGVHLRVRRKGHQSLISKSIHNYAEKNQQTQLGRLKKEMVALNRLKEEQQKHLNEKKSHLAACKQEAVTLDRQIEELMYRLQQKKLFNGNTAKNNQALKSPTSTQTTRMHTIVAAVEPLIQQTEPNVSIL